MSSPNSSSEKLQKLDEIPVTPAEAVTTTTATSSSTLTPSTTSSKIDSSTFQTLQRAHVNIERMPTSTVPKMTRPGTQTPGPPSKSDHKPETQVASETKASSSSSVPFTATSMPQAHVVIPKLAHDKHQPSSSPKHVAQSQSHSQASSAPSEVEGSGSKAPSPKISHQHSSSSSLHTLKHDKHVPEQLPPASPSQVHSPSPSSSMDPPAKPLTPIVRIKGITSGQPVLVEPSTPSSSGVSPTPVVGAKKRRGERGPDKNPNIDPRTGKRRYIKRKNKRFAFGTDPGDVNYMKKEKKKLMSKYLSGVAEGSTSKSRMRGLRKHRYYDDRHNRHHRHSSQRYSSEYYITPWNREESDAESLQSSQDDASERVDAMDSVWRPTDDLRLIMNVLQTNDLREVLLGTKFSSYYSLEEIESRWDYLLFDESMSKVSQNAIRNLPGRLKHDICSKALFSAKENALLQEIESTSDPKHLLPVMKKLLNDNPLVFLKWRTPQQLTRQWMHLRDFHLLCDQDVRKYFAQNNFEDFEHMMNDYSIYPQPFVDDAIMQEKLIHKRACRRKIRQLEREIVHWQNVAEKSIPGIRPVFAKDAYAMLRGRVVSYFMRQKEITFGRRTEGDDKKIDADLTLEGSVYKISRTQGMISLRDNGEFVILNQGKHTIYVDGRPLAPKSIGSLRDNSVIEVSLLSFVFLFNHELLRQEAERRKVEKALRMESVLYGSVPRSMFSSPSVYLPPHLSSHLSLSSSILTSSLSNTLPPLQITANKKLLGLNNTPISTTEKTLPNIPGLSPSSKPGLPMPLPQLPAGVTPRSSLLGNTSIFTRPSWYLEPSRSEPPPLTTISRISSPIMNNLQLTSYSNEPPLLRSLSLPYSSLPTTFSTMPPHSHSHASPSKTTSLSLRTFSTTAGALTTIPSSTTAFTMASSMVGMAMAQQHQHQQQMKAEQHQTVTTITMPSGTTTTTTSAVQQFGDLTIRPGVPPPTEAPSNS